MSDGQSQEIEKIEAAAAGDMQAFAELVDEHRPRVLRTAYGIVGSIEEAEDIAQEVFVKAWKSLPSYNRVGAFSSWLYRITVNAAIDRFRRRRNETPLDDLPGQGATYVATEHPEEDVIRQETRRALAAAIQALPPGARSALVLREYEQLAYSEIADILQIPIGTVMSRLNYARKLLRKELQEDVQSGAL